MRSSTIIAIALSSIVFLSGCAHYKPIVKISEFSNLSESEIRNTIIKTAISREWNICEFSQNKFRVDKITYNWPIYLNISYSQGKYQITPNTKLTTLVDRDGNVRSLLNTQALRFDNYIRYQIKKQALAHIEVPSIPKCINYESISRYKVGFWGWRSTISSEFGWENQPVHLNLKEKFYAVINGGSAPPKLDESLQERIDTHLLVADQRGIKGTASYSIEMKFTGFKHLSVGAVNDFMWPSAASQILTLEATVKENDSGKNICYVHLHISTPTGGWVGIINKSSNIITRHLGRALWNTLEEKLMNKNSSQLTDYVKKDEGSYEKEL